MAITLVTSLHYHAPLFLPHHYLLDYLAYLNKQEQLLVNLYLFYLLQILNKLKLILLIYKIYIYIDVYIDVTPAAPFKSVLV